MKKFTTCPSCQGEVEVTELAHLGACEECIAGAQDAYADFLEKRKQSTTWRTKMNHTPEQIDILREVPALLSRGVGNCGR